MVQDYTHDTLETNLEQVLNSVNALAEDTALSSEKIASILTNDMYQVFLYEQLQVDALHLTEEQLQKLGGGELIYISGEDQTFHLGQIAARPGEYFILSINMESSICLLYTSRCV